MAVINTAVLTALALATRTVHAGIVGAPSDTGGPQVHQLADGLNHLSPILVGAHLFRAATHLTNVTGHATGERRIGLQPMADNRLTLAVKSGVNFVIEFQILRLVHCIQDGHIQTPVLEVIPQISQIAQLVVDNIVGEGAPELVRCEHPVHTEVLCELSDPFIKGITTEEENTTSLALLFRQSDTVRTLFKTSNVLKISDCFSLFQLPLKGKLQGRGQLLQYLYRLNGDFRTHPRGLALVGFIGA